MSACDVLAVPVCRECGCHAEDACFDPGSPTGTCYWVEGDLCSACHKARMVGYHFGRIDLILAQYEYLRRNPELQPDDLAAFIAERMRPSAVS